MKKVLLTTSLSLDEDNNIYLRVKNEYVKAIEKAGGFPIVLPITEDDKIIEEYLDIADALIFSGGEDVNPNLYDADFHPSVQGVSFERDDFEVKLFKKAFEKKIPILGICRGMQLINVAMGGDLYQDINSEVIGSTGHSFPKDLSRGILKVKTLENSRMRKFFGEEVLVNQYHHQSVKNIAKDFIATAKSRDGIIEAMEYTGDQYINCVQFHPESLINYDPRFLQIFKELIEQ